jgi:integrase
MSHASLKKATAIGNPSERAAGLFRVVLRIDGERLVILASQACLLERLDIGERVSLKTNESIRVVELSPQACRHLSTFLESWHPNQRPLLFATRNGTPWDQNTLLKRKFKPLLRALGIQVPRGNGFHAFRHANATLMSSFGASQKLRQQRLGHADGSPVTETIYTHVISEDGKRIAEQLGNVVWGVLDASWTEKENGPKVESPKPFVIN